MFSVLHVTQPTSGGTATVVRDLALACREAGIAVTVACPNGELVSWLNAYEIGHVALPMARAPGPRDLRDVLTVRRLLDSVDLVHLHSSKAGLVGRIALGSMRQGTRPASVFTPHAWSWYSSGCGTVYKAWERLALGISDAVVVGSCMEWLDGTRLRRRSAGYDLRLIPNGVDIETFAPGQPARPATLDFPVIACVGRLTAQKGQDRLIRALAKMRHSHTRLRLVGDGPDREALAALASACHVSERVDFLGWADPLQHYREAAVIVMLSRWEGLSLSLLEAMACGRPVVGSVEAGQDVLRGCGEVVRDADDAEAVASTLDALLADPNRMRELEQSARARIVERYRIEITRQRYLALYDELVATRRLNRR